MAYSGNLNTKSKIPIYLLQLRPICHDDSMPVPEQPEKCNLDSEPESEEASPEAEISKRKDQDFSA